MIRLVDEFTVPVAPDAAFSQLLELPNVAHCVPGGSIGPPDAEGVYPGTVMVKLGPMQFRYEGTLRIVERDDLARQAVIEGAGRTSGGAERASVRSHMAVLSDGSGTRVLMTTELDIKGRAASLGAGIIASVSRRMVKQAADCLASRLASTDVDQDRNDEEPT